MKPSVKFKLLLTKCFSVSCIHLPPNLDYLNPGYPLKQLLDNGILVTVEILVQLLTRQENKGDTAAIRHTRFRPQARFSKLCSGIFLSVVPSLKNIHSDPHLWFIVSLIVYDPSKGRRYWERTF